MVIPGAPLPDNATLAANLREFADILTQQQADGFRISAYRRAADVVASLTQPVSETLKTSGHENGLKQLFRFERSANSFQLRPMSCCAISAKADAIPWPIPGIGEELATRLHEHLHTETLEALEQAAHDGRLEQLEGFGPTRSNDTHGSRRTAGSSSAAPVAADATAPSGFLSA